MSVEVKIATKTTAEVIVNGVSKGVRTINGGPSLKDFATQVAKESGIRSFTVTIDEGHGPTPGTSANLDRPVAEGAKVEVKARDSRGHREGKGGCCTPALSLGCADEANEEYAELGDGEEEEEEAEATAVLT